MIVMKFGGTSLGNAQRIKNTANIIKSRVNDKPIVICSAVGGITDKLINLTKAAIQSKGDEELLEIKNIHLQILKDLELEKDLLNGDFEKLDESVKNLKSRKILDAKTFDLFQSFGEQMSTKIVAATLRNQNVPAKAYNSWEIGFLTNSNFGEAEMLEDSFSAIQKSLKNLDHVAIITGFIGKDKHDVITTLGRGGSDYSASIIGSSTNAREIQIWSDVDGIMSTDPRIISTAKTVDKVSFAEAAELSFFGAEVLHPKTILPAMKKNIPVKVYNTMNPENNGTTILESHEDPSSGVKAIAFKKKIKLINVTSTRMLGAHGFLAKLFSIFEKHEVSVDVIATSEVSVSMTVDKDEDLTKLLTELKLIGTVSMTDDKSMICVVGDGINENPEIVAKTFNTLFENNINVKMISLGASRINITFLVEREKVGYAVKALHKTYFGE